MIESRQLECFHSKCIFVVGGWHGSLLGCCYGEAGTVVSNCINAKQSSE